MNQRLFIFAGEPSGDLHGSYLIKALRGQGQLFFIEGVAGPSMRPLLDHELFPMEDFLVMGLVDVMKSLPKLVRRFFAIKHHILQHNPDAIILIDYPGFNLRLAKSLKKSGFKGKIIQYISPTVWAHGKERITLLEQNYHLLLAILPFEPKYYASTRLSVKYVGHPLVQTIQSHCYDANFFDQLSISPNDSLLGLFPGSRPSEIKEHLQTQLEVAQSLLMKVPKFKIAICCAQDQFKDGIQKKAKELGLVFGRDFFMIHSKFRYELMKRCTLALAKSGTVSLELALLNVPSVIHYKVPFVNYLYAKYVLKLNLPYFCLVNIIANQEVFPEFFGKEAFKDAIQEELLSYLNSPEKMLAVKSECEALKTTLGHQEAHKQAAISIRDLLRDQ